MKRQSVIVRKVKSSCTYLTNGRIMTALYIQQLSHPMKVDGGLTTDPAGSLISSPHHPFLRRLLLYVTRPLIGVHYVTKLYLASITYIVYFFMRISHRSFLIINSHVIPMFSIQLMKIYRLNVLNVSPL